MDIIIALLAVAFGGLIFYKKKADKAEVENKLIETKAKDQALHEQQAEIKSAMETLDKGIARLKEEREAEMRKRKEDSLTLKERRDRIRKGIK